MTVSGKLSIINIIKIRGGCDSDWQTENYDYGFCGLRYITFNISAYANTQTCLPGKCVGQVASFSCVYEPVFSIVVFHQSRQ
jgi:hypothetical protein